MKRAVAVAAAMLVAGLAFSQDKPPAVAGQVCAACHAADGNSIAAANPKIAGQFAEYLAKQLRDFKSLEGKPPLRQSAVMNGMAANLSDADMKSLAAYYSKQAYKPAAAADKELAALGQKLWRGGDAVHGIPACGGCHGPAGAGIPAQFPRLAGQHAQYTEEKLKQFRVGERANDPNRMMRLVAEKLSDREIAALAQYIQGLH